MTPDYERGLADGVGLVLAVVREALPGSDVDEIESRLRVPTSVGERAGMKCPASTFSPTEAASATRSQAAGRPGCRD